jgi:hypothetical protein
MNIYTIQILALAGFVACTPSNPGLSSDGSQLGRGDAGTDAGLGPDAAAQGPSEAGTNDSGGDTTGCPAAPVKFKRGVCRKDCSETTKTLELCAREAFGSAIACVVQPVTDNLYWSPGYPAINEGFRTCTPQEECEMCNATGDFCSDRCAKDAGSD